MGFGGEPHLQALIVKESIRILQHGDAVAVIINGRLATEAPMPWQHAREIAKRLLHVAGLAEEHAKALHVAHDAAILQRAGANIGITSDPRILDEAGKLAAWDSDLRRYMPGGVKSQEQFGRPSLIDHNRGKTS